ncbi:MAG: hypothetical protein OXE99_03275 [Cellvibrionales bacterium]|nr:hypothetical protein [Cellvibrionales bacterium]
MKQEPLVPWKIINPSKDLYKESEYKALYEESMALKTRELLTLANVINSMDSYLIFKQKLGNARLPQRNRSQVDKALSGRWKQLNIKDYTGLPLKTDAEESTFVELDNKIQLAGIKLNSNQYRNIMGKALSRFPPKLIESWFEKALNNPHITLDQVKNISQRLLRWQNAQYSYQRSKKP